MHLICVQYDLFISVDKSLSVFCVSAVLIYIYICMEEYMEHYTEHYDVISGSVRVFSFGVGRGGGRGEGVR